VIKVKKGECAITCLEVWEGCELLSRSSAEGVHEGVSGQSTGLGGLSWGGDETFVVYVAERVKPPSASFFKTPPSTAAAAATAGAAGVAVGTDFDLRDDWGEKLVGSDRLALFKFDFAVGLIAHVPGSDGGGSDNGGCLTPAQPVVITAPQDGSSSVVFVAYPHSPKKLGLVYCYQRPCHLRRIPLPPPPPLTPLEAVEDTTGAAAATSDTSIAATATPSTVPFQVLTKGESVAFSPRLSQSGDCLAYLGSSDGFDTHQGSLELKLLDLKALEPLRHSLSTATATSTDEDGGGGVAAAAVPVLASRRVLVPSSSSGDAAAAASTVTLDPTCPGGFSFPGLWWPSELPEKCWGADDATVWFTSLWGSRPCAFAADVASGELTRIPYGGTVPTGACGEQQEQGVGGSSGCAVKVLAACTSLGGALVAWSSPVHPGGVAFVLPKDKESAAAAGGWVWVEAPALGRQAITSTPTIGSGFSAAATAIEAARWFSTATPNPAPSLLAGNNGASGGGEGGDANGGSWRILSVVPPDSKSGVPIEAILVIPPPPLQSPLQTATATAETVTTSAGGQGLIVVPHGGPHSTTPTSFVATYNFLAAETNCAVLHGEIDS
jgi:acylaminoacyl-peptidase